MLFREKFSIIFATIKLDEVNIYHLNADKKTTLSELTSVRWLKFTYHHLNKK